MRSLYIWNRVAGLTDSYHDGGGLVVIASSLDRAREILTAEAGVQENCEAFTIPPDMEVECAGEEYIAVHPDAGCC